MRKYLIILIILFPILYISCAKVGSPTGGPKDTIPPNIVKSKPLNYDTSFSESKIIIKFDEFFQYSDINSKFFASPPFAELPDFSIYGKKMIIQLNEELKDTTTYTFYFQDAIQDFTESNPIDNYQFVFSTGNIIDSFIVAGFVYKSESLEKSENTFVMLYKNDYDSVPYSERPYFVAKTDTSGYFFIKNIKPANYKVFALSDMNNNMIYDMPNEEIAFLDTNIFASVKSFHKIDTFQNIKYIYDSINVDLIIDSISTDSIVNNIYYEYSPDNLKLFIFDEDNNKQFIKEAIREKKGKVVLTFNKELNDNFSILPLNFDLESPKIETFEEKDSIIYWITDNNLLDKDTFILSVEYHQIDSAFNVFPEIDTVYLSFDNEDADSMFVSISSNLSQKFDLYEQIEIETGTPINIIDTSKIKIYQLIDTAVIQDMTQKVLKAERHKKDLLVFTFQRPLIEDCEILLANNKISKDKYVFYINEQRDSVSFKILDKTYSEIEDLDVVIFYDNLYFFDKYQELKTRFILKVDKLQIVAKKRKLSKEIEILFNKNIENDFTIKLLNENIADWCNTIYENNLLKIQITNETISKKDTLILSFNSIDYIDFENTAIEFDDTLSVITKPDEQHIIDCYRDFSNHFVIEFAYNLNEEPKIKLLNSNLTKWCNSDYYANTKIVEYEIYHQGTRNLEEIDLLVSYKSTDKFDEIIEKTDTLKLLTDKSRTKNENDSVYVEIQLEKNFDIRNDSLHQRKYIIDFKKIPEKKYILSIDSIAFTDIFDLNNDTINYLFETQSEDYYGNMIINLTNLGALQYNQIELISMNLDTVIQQIDTIADVIDTTLITTKKNIDKLNRGQAIFYLINQKEETIFQTIMTESKTIEIQNLLPETYILKIIYDQNANGKWDTGNYLLKIQPEKVFYYESNTSVKSGFDTEIDWILETY